MVAMNLHGLLRRFAIGRFGKGNFHHDFFEHGCSISHRACAHDTTGHLTRAIDKCAQPRVLDVENVY